MNNSGNQIRNKMIQSYPKTDREKLAGLERHVHQKYYSIAVAIEPIMMFTKGEDEYVGTEYTLDKGTVEKYLTHPPDMILYINGKMVVFELEGSWHITHNSKDVKRNKRYELNKIPYFMLVEEVLKKKLRPDIYPESWKLSQEQINAEFDKKIQPFLKVY